MVIEPSSFRDPSGYIFEHEGIIYRNINKSYATDYELLLGSGLLDKLWSRDFLVRHTDVTTEFVGHTEYKVVKPQRIPLISYPYEWCFSQLQAAAVLTLQILTESLKAGMILKDASAYNIQFDNLRPKFIDTLSFEAYADGQFWKGYRQFCEHFLGPLCLAVYNGVEYLRFLRLHPDGIPIHMLSKLLPARSWLSPVPLMNIHLHAMSQTRYEKTGAGTRGQRTISKNNLLAMIDHLLNFVTSMKVVSQKSQWSDYAEEIHYTADARESKFQIVESFLVASESRVIWDIGGNDGFFSRRICKSSRTVLSLDADPLAIDKNYIEAKDQRCQNYHVLLFEVENPSPDLGFANAERKRLSLRSYPDTIVALALIHHIVITHNIQFVLIARYFASLAPNLIIEFVPEIDEKVKMLPDNAGKLSYNKQNFLSSFLAVFTLLEEKKIECSERTIFLFKRK